MIKSKGRGYESHLGQSFSLSLCGPSSLPRANAQMGKLGNFSALNSLIIIHILHGKTSPEVKTQAMDLNGCNNALTVVPLPHSPQIYYILPL